MPDPRVFFAAERTLLAWVRSGLTVMAMGFVVERFGLVLEIGWAGTVAPNGPRSGHLLASALGIGLVLLGAGVVLGALHNHRRYVRSLPPDHVPRLALPWLTSALAMSVAAAGVLLALYLLAT